MNLITLDQFKFIAVILIDTQNTLTGRSFFQLAAEPRINGMLLLWFC